MSACAGNSESKDLPHRRLQGARQDGCRRARDTARAALEVRAAGAAAAADAANGGGRNPPTQASLGAPEKAFQKSTAGKADDARAALFAELPVAPHTIESRYWKDFIKAVKNTSSSCNADEAARPRPDARQTPPVVYERGLLS